MSRFRRIDILEPYCSPLVSVSEIETSVLAAPKTLSFPSFLLEEETDDVGFALDLLRPSPSFAPFELFNTVTDLIQVEKTPSYCSYKRIQQQQQQQRAGTELFLQTLCDKVSALEARFDRLVKADVYGGERKYKWTAEIKGPVERKYTWTTEIKEPNKKNKREPEKNYKWTAEFKGKGDEWPISRKYTFEASTGKAADHESKKEKEKEKKGGKKEKKAESSTRVVEIEAPADHGALVLRQAFAKRIGAIRNIKGKKKELSPQDAALLIQMTFRAYLIRRSQALRALRELAIAKAKLKEIRALFNNFSYRRQVSRDAGERQRFSERIIVLLLTVDAIEGGELMVRAAKRSMVDELEAMLDVIDPQPSGKSLSMRRRTFDMPDGVIRKEIAEGVSQVVQMLNEDGASTFDDAQ